MADYCRLEPDYVDPDGRESTATYRDFIDYMRTFRSRGWVKSFFKTVILSTIKHLMGIALGILLTSFLKDGHTLLLLITLGVFASWGWTMYALVFAFFFNPSQRYYGPVHEDDLNGKRRDVPEQPFEEPDSEETMSDDAESSVPA